MSKLMSLAGLVPSNEGIEFQNGAFFKQLVLVLEQHDKSIRRSLTKTDFTKLGADLDTVIKKFTGLKTDVEWVEMDMNAYVMAPMVDLNSPIYRATNEYYVSNYGDGAITGVDFFVEKKGSAFNLDPKTGRVSGEITEEVFNIGLAAISYRTGSLTDEEMMADLLHEVGHVFSMLECLDQTCSSNAVLTELDARLRSGLAPKERQVVLERAGKVLGFEREVIEDAIKATADSVVLTIYVGHTLRNIRSSSGDSFFDVNTWETLADQYATRHGAGRALTTSLDKLYAHYGVSEKIKSTATYFLFEVLKLVKAILMKGGLGVSLLMVGGALMAAVATSLPMMIIGILAFLIGAGVAVTHFEDDGTYASPTNRLIRIRQQLVEQIKRNHHEVMPLEMQQQLLADIATCDAIAVLYKQSSSWFDAAANFLSSSRKNKQASIKFQKALESLSMNDLFVKSLELKV